MLIKAFLKLTILPKTLMYTPTTNPKQKHMETTQEHEKGALLLNNSHRGRTYSQWRASLLVVASKHCSLSHYSSPWQADGEQTLLSVTL